MRNKRPDATPAENVPRYRRIMPFLMPGRNESVVYFEQQIDTTEASRFAEAWQNTHPELRVTIFHLITWAAVTTLREHPRLNRFVAGGRLWQRDGIWISYSAKKAFSDKAPVVVLKRRFDSDETFEQMVRGMLGNIKEGRSDKPSRVDKELSAILRMPSSGVRALLRVGRLADEMGLLPASFIDSDPMYSSLFIANLGSLRMDAAYHHLFEYGNCPIFVVIGQTKETPWAVDGQVVVRPIVTLRYSYDERIEDGFYAQRALDDLKRKVENPETFIAI
jgi:hypothetical protein